MENAVGHMVRGNKPRIVLNLKGKFYICRRCKGSLLKGYMYR